MGILHHTAAALLLISLCFSCPNAETSGKSNRSLYYVREWAQIYLAAAHARLVPQLEGYALSVEDVFTMQQLCAYEVLLPPSVYDDDD